MTNILTNILIVDDEEHIRKDLAFYLERKKKFSTIIASTLNEAIYLIKEKKQIFKYAIIDLKLDNPSEYSGIQIYCAIKKFRPNVTSIILSAYPLSEEIEEQLKEELKKDNLYKNERVISSLLSEFKDNYISKGDEENYLITILKKLDNLE